MGWIYGANSMGSTKRTTIASAIVVMGSMVLLLWFGSLRDPGVALAAEFDTNGDQSIHERCFLDTYCLETGLTGIGTQSLGEQQAGSAVALETGDSLQHQLLGAAVNSGGGGNVERCLLPGIPCTQVPDPVNTGVNGAGLVATALQTY